MKANIIMKTYQVTEHYTTDKFIKTISAINLRDAVFIIFKRSHYDYDVSVNDDQSFLIAYLNQCDNYLTIEEIEE